MAMHIEKYMVIRYRRKGETMHIKLYRELVHTTLGVTMHGNCRLVNGNW